ncbi:hypothetical protein Nepgr_015229 [Nepenthes gracilis]|uniref:Uncharacterized protein n=1 Tax=Nepenthes gracilis TaxID=150966 RepID=A0AAD3SLE2_NEPGR|nr:hypothetical protein Nepgr_015229 [Nepenthes gracilis]
MLKRGSKLSKLVWSIAQSCQLPIIVICLGLVLVVPLLFGHNYVTVNLGSSMHHDPTMELINKTEVIWQIPDSSKAVLFLAHGCHGRALNFWDRSINCPICVGLPEERLIALNALARKFAVLTISSRGTCWSLGEERQVVKNIIKWWVEKNNLAKLPLVALGASSGGYFVSALATELRFSSIVLMIAEGMFSRMDIREDYPPTLFVHMPKDRHRNRMIAENIQFLRKRGIDAQEIQCLEFPLTPDLLANRIPGLDQTTSVKLYELFRDKGFIDARGNMKKDGRQTRWKEALRESGVELLHESKFIHHIQEELNLAFSYHEMTSLKTDQIFEWFDTHMR